MRRFSLLEDFYSREGADGIVKYFLACLKYDNLRQAEEIVDFFETKKYKSAISKDLKKRLVGEAQREQSRHNNNNGGKPACQLGKVIFGKWKFEQLIRATA